MASVPMRLCKPHRVPECPQCKKGTKMAGKCEHGLTTHECMVCASPKYGAETGDKWVTIPRARLAALEEMEQVVEWLLDDGHMNQEHLARLRAAWEMA
jgi:Zn ribbon nucleic-acid-binding protein